MPAASSRPAPPRKWPRIRPSVTCSSSPPMLEAKNISAGYGSVPVLRDVDVRVDKGEIVLIVGENGAGKSTLLRTLGGFIKPDKGTVMYNGEDVTGQSPEKL